MHELDRLPTYDNYIIKSVERLTQLREWAHDNLITSKIKSKDQYDKKLNPVEFEIEDKVFLLKRPKPQKFGDHYDGPYEILEIYTDGNIRIQLGNQTKSIHPNRLKKTVIETPEKPKTKRTKAVDPDPVFRP